MATLTKNQRRLVWVGFAVWLIGIGFIVWLAWGLMQIAGLR